MIGHHYLGNILYIISPQDTVLSNHQAQPVEIVLISFAALVGMVNSENIELNSIE